MSYETFRRKVAALAKSAGVKVRFSTGGGKHYASLSDGTVIIGNNSCLRVTVKWGGHQSMAAI